VEDRMIDHGGIEWLTIRDEHLARGEGS
jgi:hypothetical protein